MRRQIAGFVDKISDFNTLYRMIYFNAIRAVNSIGRVINDVISTSARNINGFAAGPCSDKHLLIIWWQYTA